MHHPDAEAGVYSFFKSYKLERILVYDTMSCDCHGHFLAPRLEVEKELLLNRWLPCQLVTGNYDDKKS